MHEFGTRRLVVLFGVLMTVLACLALVQPVAEGATGTSYAPVDRPGPALSVPSSGPDARAKVSSLVGIAPDNNNGATIGAEICAIRCPPAVWQESVTLTGRPAHFMTAMNSGQATFPGIAYTAIYSYTDEVAGLNIGPHPVAPLPAAPNVLDVPIQSMCPGQVFEHLTIPASSVAYAIAIRALEHPGRLPDLASIDRPSTCARLWMPGVSTATDAAHLIPIGAAIGPRLLQGDVSSEPPLKCYVYLSGRCPS